MPKYKVTIERITIEEAEFTLEVSPDTVIEDVDWGELAEAAMTVGAKPEWELTSEEYQIADEAEPEEV